MRGPRGRALGWVALAVALAAYLAIGLHELNLPGFYYDEAFDALPAVELLVGAKPNVAMSVTLFGRDVPLMLHPHIGPTSTYLSLLAFLVAGVSVAAVRAAHLAVGALTLVLLWSLARRWFDDLIAASSVLLCATAPAFVWWNRAGANFSATMLPLALGVVLLLDGWARTRRPLHLAAAGFLFGAGVATKINFMWLCAPLALTALVIHGVHGLRRLVAGITTSEAASAIAAFLVGAAPLLIYNLRTGGGTLRFVSRNAVHTEYGQDNLAFLHNLGFLLRDFTTVMGGGTGEFPSPSAGMLAGVLFIASTIYLALRCLRLRGRPRAMLFLVVTVATLMPLGTVTTSHVGARHLFMLVPFAWLIVAVATVDAARVARAWTARLGRIALVGVALPYALIALVVVGHLRNQVGIHRFMAATGGFGFWSDTISTLAERLQTTYADRDPVAMDWGLMRSIAFLTATRVTPREAFEYLPEPSSAFEGVAAQLVSESRNLYLFHAPGFTVFAGYREALDTAAAASGKHLRLVDTLTQRDGTPNILVYTVEAGP